MRARVVFTLMVCLLAWTARAQAPLEVGSAESAFSGSPIRLSRSGLAALRAHYQGDKVPLIPQPYRAKLDTAVLGRDWTRVDALKKELVASQGIVTALAWEQSRFIATGSIGVAELHALDVAATGSTGLSETAVMMWFYAVAVTMTDGHKCIDAAAKDAHLDRLRGPAFEPVTRIVRTIADDRLAAMRDLAIRLEAVLAPDRTDDTMCRQGNGKADIKPDALWRPQAATTRAMLARHLVALASIMRPRPVAGGKPEAAKAAPARPAPPTREPARPVSPPPDVARIAPAIPGPELAEPVLPATAAPPAGASTPGPAGSAVIDPAAGKPDPGRFGPARMELTRPDQQR